VTVPKKKGRPPRRKGGKVGRPKGRQGKKDPNVKHTLGVELKTTRALELKQEGWSYSKIAEMLTAELGEQYGTTSKQRAEQLVKAALDERAQERKDAVDRVVTLELMRLDEMTIGFFQKARDNADTFAASTVLAIMDRRARLLGLNAPTKTINENTGTDGGPMQHEVALTDAAASFDAKATKVIEDALSARAAPGDDPSAGSEGDDPGLGVGPGDDRGSPGVYGEPDAG
jgi:hypothetical protein